MAITTTSGVTELFFTDSGSAGITDITSTADWTANTIDLGGGVRQMIANQTYVIQGQVTRSFTLRANGINRVTTEKVLSSSDEYTGTGFAYQCFGANDGMSFDNITIIASSGLWMDATDGLFIGTDRCSIQANQLGQIESEVIFLAFTRFGNVGAELESVALLITGTNRTSIDVVNCAFFPDQTEALLPCINFGTSTYNDVRIESTKFNLGGTNRSIVGLSSGGNLINAGFVNHCDMTGSSSPLLGVDPADDPWVFTGNLGVSDSVANIGCSVTGNVAATAISAGVGDDGNPIKVNVATTASSYDSERFSIATNGTITYNGTNPFQLGVLFSGIADTASGTNKDYTFYVAINGTVITGSSGPISLDSADPGRFATQALIDVSTSDTVDLFVENNTDTVDITVSSYTCVIN